MYIMSSWWPLKKRCHNLSFTSLYNKLKISQKSPLNIIMRSPKGLSAHGYHVTYNSTTFGLCQCCI
jgi:hypothetical protein